MADNRGVYVASRTRHAPMWRELRDKCGRNICSTWIDEAEAGQSSHGGLDDLWIRIRSEISNARGLVLYAWSEDFPLKGALIEAGIALALNVPIRLVLPEVEIDLISSRPIGSWIEHPNVNRFYGSVHDAVLSSEVGL